MALSRADAASMICRPGPVPAAVSRAPAFWPGHGDLDGKLAFIAQFTSQLVEAQKSGCAFELLHKPVDSEQILTVVTAVLEGPVAFGWAEAG